MCSASWKVCYSWQLSEHYTKIFIKIATIIVLLFVKLSVTLASCHWNGMKSEWSTVTWATTHTCQFLWESTYLFYFLFVYSVIFHLADVHWSRNLTIKNIARSTMKLSWILEAPARRQLNMSYLKRKTFPYYFDIKKFKKLVKVPVVENLVLKHMYYIVIKFPCQVQIPVIWRLIRVSVSE
jgi:hypothetical protein